MFQIIKQYLCLYLALLLLLGDNTTGGKLSEDRLSQLLDEGSVICLILLVKTDDNNK